MNAINRIAGADLRDAQKKAGVHESMLAFADDKRNPVKATYLIEQFTGFFDPSSKRIICLRIPRFCDVMAPHSIDIPPWQIEKIELVVGTAHTFFDSMAEASFYYHIRSRKNDLSQSLRMFIHLKAGFERERCTVAWRCYFLNMEPRDTMFAHEGPYSVPVAKDVEFDGKTFNKRLMARL